MKKVVLLTGNIGTGRTTLFNKITNSNKKTTGGGSNVTREVYVKDSQYGNGFTLIDTPGFGSIEDDNGINIMGIYLNTFENFEISRIMITVGYSEHLAILNYSCKQVMQMFESYKDKITLVITSFDQCDNKEYARNEIINKFKKNWKIESFIFTSRFDSGETLCQLFDSEIKYSQASKIKFSEAQMLSQLQYGRQEILFQYAMFEEDLIQKFHQIRKQLSYLANLNADNFKEINKRFIKQIVEIGWKEFQSFSFNIDEQNNYLVYQKFRNFINQETNNMTLQKYEQQFKQYENELKDYFEELMKPYDQKFEASRQNCLRDILNNVKKQKIKFL